MNAPDLDNTERLRRWRLILGDPAGEPLECDLPPRLANLDRVLQALYDSDRRGGLGSSCPNVHRWLGEIREYFPASVVQVMQRDALDRLGLQRMLLEPELLSAVQPDVHLAATLLSLSRVLPKRTRETARQVVRRVTEDLQRRLKLKTLQTVGGALRRAGRTRRPRPNQIDWQRTIRANLRHWLPEHRTVVPERLIGHGRARSGLRHLVLCVDQSASMATSVVYASIFACTLASVRSLSTRLVVFDTAVVDLTPHLGDPVDVLFGTQLGGGTDIDQALAYCAQHIQQPSSTILVLISDLYEGGDEKSMLRRLAALVAQGVQVVCLLALSDTGAPGYDHQQAVRLAGLGIPALACTPDLFPELMAAAIQRQDLSRWAARNEVVLTRPQTPV